MLDAINKFINQPVVIFFIAAVFMLLVLKFQNIDIHGFILAVNSISSQPFALVVLMLGFWMLIECKKWSIDTTIAGGVIGVASNMLQSQIKDAAHLGPTDIPPGSKVKSVLSTDVTAPSKDATAADSTPAPEPPNPV